MSSKKIIYMQGVDKFEGNVASFEPKLQPDDMLSIIVSAENPELTVPFNMPQIQVEYDVNKSQSSIKTYLIDSDGYINYPLIGHVKVAGLSKFEANELLVGKISGYFKTTPTVSLELLNFKISVLGEVKLPNVYDVKSDRITILEAISRAGDLTIFGKRENVLIIRELNGKKTFNRVNLTKPDFINSPFYYLKQNDIIIVEPNKTHINNGAVGANISTILTSASILITLLFYFIKK